jgi:hypothetical protein
MVWNDDALMMTKSWDTILKKIYEKEELDYVVYRVPNNYFYKLPFPILSKNIIDYLGHMSYNTHIDTWIEDIAEYCGIIKDIKEIMTHHRRIDIEKDKKNYVKIYGDYQNTVNNITRPEYFSEHISFMREIDKRALKMIVDLSNELEYKINKIL